MHGFMASWPAPTLGTYGQLHLTVSMMSFISKEQFNIGTSSNRMDCLITREYLNSLDKTLPFTVTMETILWARMVLYLTVVKIRTYSFSLLIGVNLGFRFLLNKKKNELRKEEHENLQLERRSFYLILLIEKNLNRKWHFKDRPWSNDILSVVEVQTTLGRTLNDTNTPQTKATHTQGIPDANTYI